MLFSQFNQRERTPVNLAPTDGRTDQSFRDAANINKIMAQYERTGDIPGISQKTANYGDFSNVRDYHTSLLQIQAADESFMALPAPIRKRMGNSPQGLMDFLSDPENAEEALSLGLTEKTETNRPAPADPVVETPPETPSS